MDGWVAGGWVGGWMDEWMGGWVGGWVGEWVDGWMDGWGGWHALNAVSHTIHALGTIHRGSVPFLAVQKSILHLSTVFITVEPAKPGTEKMWTLHADMSWQGNLTNSQFPVVSETGSRRSAETLANEAQ